MDESSAIDQYVYGSELRRGTIDCALVRYVQSTRRAIQSGQKIGSNIRRDRSGAELDAAFRDCATNALAGSRDERALTLQIEHD
jgi:hypothetical protein